MVLYCDISGAAFLLLYDQSKAVLFFSTIVQKHLELFTDVQTGSVFQQREKVQNTFDFDPLFFSYSFSEPFLKAPCNCELQR